MWLYFPFVSRDSEYLYLVTTKEYLGISVHFISLMVLTTAALRGGRLVSVTEGTSASQTLPILIT